MPVKIDEKKKKKRIENCFAHYWVKLRLQLMEIFTKFMLSFLNVYFHCNNTLNKMNIGQ